MQNWDPKKDEALQSALKEYLDEHNLSLNDNDEFITCDDTVIIRLGEDFLLIIGLPPASNYEIRMRETRRLI